MKKHTKVFLVVITVMASGMAWHYFNGGSVTFAPNGTEGSAVDAVKGSQPEKKIATTNKIVGEVNLQGPDAQNLIKDPQFRKMILNENFRNLLESPSFTEFTKSQQFKAFIESPNLKELEKSPQFSELTRKPGFIVLSQNPMFLDLMKNEVLTAIVRNSQFVELEKLALASFD